MTAVAGFLVGMLAQAPAPFVADSAAGAPGRLHIGDTGIRCVRMPCPSRGVYQPGENGHAVRGQLLYADPDGVKGLPPMMGDEKLLIAIREAWDDHRCLAVDGRLIGGEDDRPVLRVDRIAGACGPE